MNNMPLVSILIPLYNAEKYIKDTICSCLNQSYTNIEVIVVDDGSLDSSLSIAQSYEERYENIRVYTQKNSGAQRARNLAFEKSKGEYIQYLDADDLLSENKISSQMSLAKQYGNNNTYSSKFIRFKEFPSDHVYAKRNIDKSYDSGVDWLIASWTGAGMGQTSIWLTPRSLIEHAGLWNESLDKNQDGEFFCRVLLSTKKVIYTDEAIVFYRDTGKESISQQMTESAAKATLLSYDLYRKHITKRATTELNKALAFNYYSFINHFYPKFPHLIQEAESCIKQLGVSQFSVFQSGKFSIFSRLIGYKYTLKFRHIMRNLGYK